MGPGSQAKKGPSQLVGQAQRILMPRLARGEIQGSTPGGTLAHLSCAGIPVADTPAITT